ncbi:MAG TPA: hypothetical protein VGC76_07945 [Pyrinomonadaceae bacterium]
MSLENVLDKIHGWMTKSRVLQIFTVATRLLLFAGFTPPSLIKIMNKPFTVLPDSNPVGHYFNALYQTGFYYQFIGWSQLVAAILLLFPQTAHLGALMFLPIIVNIAVLTTSVGFVGTWVVTIFMALAAMWLVAWDYDRLKPILFYKRETKANVFKLELVWLPLLFAVGGACVAGIWAIMRLGNFRNYWMIALYLFTGGLIFGFAAALHHRFMPAGDLRRTSEIT